MRIKPNKTKILENCKMFEEEASVSTSVYLRSNCIIRIKEVKNTKKADTEFSLEKMDKQLSCTIINLLFGNSKISQKFKIKESEKILYEILENFYNRLFKILRKTISQVENDSIFEKDKALQFTVLMEYPRCNYKGKMIFNL